MTTNIALSVAVVFDEEEIFNAFETLSKKTGEPIEFTIDIQQVEKKLYYNFILKSGDEAIRLEKPEFEQYRAAMSPERLEKFLKEN